jgi:hypothetical protein
MTDAEIFKVEIKKLSARALKLKMDLHDLAEELPVGWQNILHLAKDTYDAFALLETKRKELAESNSEVNSDLNSA